MNDDREESADPAKHDLEPAPPSQERIAFWCAMASQFGGPVLDLCCGTGLVAIPVAAMGLSVTGVDLAAPRLAHAAAKAESQDVDVRWLLADVRALALPRRFGFVMLTGKAFHDDPATADRQALLAAVRRHLAPEGAFGFEARPAEAGEIADLLDATGLEIVAQYGDWNFAPARAGSERLITLCRRRAGA